MFSRLIGRTGALVAAVFVAALGGHSSHAQTSQGQAWPPGPGAQPQAGQSYQAQVCTRLEGQLASIDRGSGGDPARAEQTRRYEEASNRQQAELDRMSAQARRQGCEGTGFFLFGGAQSQQCVDLNGQISRMRGNLDRINMDLQRVRGSDLDRGEQRRSVMVALAQNNCGPQYRTAARAPGGFFDQLFNREGATEPNEPSSDLANPDVQGGSFRTICVRTCDGFYFPISYATSPARFPQDEKSCQRLCPAAETQLFSYRTQGGDVASATSTAGQTYSALPNAFKYRQAFDAACSCKKPGQSWSEALGKDESVESGDIVVTEDRAKQMALPPAQKGQAKGRAPAATGTVPVAPAQTAVPAAAAAPAAADGDQPKKPVRAVGPTFIPAR